MERLKHRDLRRLNAVLRQLYAHSDLQTFPVQTLAALSQIVPANILGYNEINLRRQRLVAMTDPHDACSPNDEQIMSSYLHEQPIVAAYKRTRNGRAYKMSDFLSRAQFHRLAMYNEFYRERKTEHLMAIMLPAPSPLAIAYAFSRSRRDFSERDRLVLDVLRQHLIQAYHNAAVATQIRQESAQLKQALEESDRGIISLTGEGRVQLMTKQARCWVYEYFGKSPRHTVRVPEALWRWVCQQRTTLVRSDDVPPPRPLLEVEREGKRLVVRLLTDQDGPLLLLLEEQRTLLSPTLLAPLGLTKRENEILYWVAQGKTNKEVALRLGLSPHTVRTRLENIYGKLGVETRTAAAARVLDTLGLTRQ